ncbi:MAG: hypothetical protein U0168_06555 [Nannocystaceae bacterium]
MGELDLRARERVGVGQQRIGALQRCARLLDAAQSQLREAAPAQGVGEGARVGRARSLPQGHGVVELRQRLLGLARREQDLAQVVVRAGDEEVVLG